MKLIIFIFLIAIQSTSADIKDNLATIKVNSPLINEVVSIQPIKDHHFNLQAPQKCSESKTASAINPSPSTITCQFHTPGKHSITVSVCDNEKKYCKQEYFQVNVSPKKSGVKKIASAPLQPTKNSQETLKKIILPGFYNVAPQKARSLLKPHHKGVMVLASAEWCPPCNKNKEFLFPQKEFQEASENLLKVYVDGDSQDMTQWKSLIDFKYYPSFIFLNRDFEQMDIRISDTDTYNFKKWVEEFYKLPNTPIMDVISRFQSRKNGSLWRKAKDFIGGTNHQQDKKRIIKWYEHNYDFLSLYKLVKDDAATYPILHKMAEVAHLENSLSGTKNKTKVTNINAQLESKTLEILKSKPQDYINYSELLQKNCSAPGKAPFDKASCSKYTDKYIESLKFNRDKDKAKLTTIDRTARAATYHATKLRYEKLKGLPEKRLTSLRTNCFDTFEILKSLSPLKEKSRYTKTRQVLCLSDKSLQNSGLAILDQLINDYPYEEVYYRKKSKILTANKKYRQSLSIIDKAIKYSYGNLVYYNNISKAEILNLMDNKAGAIKLLNDLINSFDLTKDSKSEQQLLNQIRNKIAELSKA